MPSPLPYSPVIHEWSWKKTQIARGDRWFLELNFVGVNRLFVLVYMNKNDDVKQFNAEKYCLPKGIIVNYNVITNGKKYMTKQLIQI